MKPEEYATKVMSMVEQAFEPKKEPPDGASIELTITINGDAWAEYQSRGYSDINIQRELVEEVKHALTHNKDRKLMADFEELHVRKYY